MSLEPVAVPILMQAIDFLFGEAKKILEERRAARQQARHAQPGPRTEERHGRADPPLQP